LKEIILKTSGNTILITGGGTGIGLALAEILTKAGNQVIICGRREKKLLEAKEKLPGIYFRTCDVANPDDRHELFDWSIKNFGLLNILVNNAGIQKQIDFKKGEADLLGDEKEIEINLSAPVFLSALFIPHLIKQPEAAIINVTSGLGFVPIAMMPVYGATKAAMHSFSLSLRHQLKGTSVKVFEIIPPTVDTELDRGARASRGQQDRGIKPDEVAQSSLLALEKDEYEAPIGRAQFLRMGARNEPEKTFEMINSH
jgi:uncharacterized oxidoreductase